MSPKVWLPTTAAFALLAVPQVTTRVPMPAQSTMPITGSVTVTNQPDVRIVNIPDVSIVNAPVVNARQSGDWYVTVAGATVPSFLQAGHTYRFLWEPSGRVLTYRVVGVRPDGWIQVQVDAARSGGAVWINPATAAIIEER